MTDLIPAPHPLYQSIRDILLAAQTQVRQTVNTAMVQAYWQIGRLIVEDEQGVEKRAEYGKRVLPELTKRLSAEFGKGFALANLRNFRQFFLNFSWEETRYTACSELSAKRSCALNWSATAPCWKARVRHRMIDRTPATAVPRIASLRIAHESHTLLRVIG